MTELNKRIMVALWGIPLLLFLSYMGGYYFLALILLINAMALWEFYNMFTGKTIYAYRNAGVALSTLFLISTFFYPAYGQTFFFLIIAVVLLVQLRPQRGLSSQNSALTLAGIVYITVFLAALLQLRLNFQNWIPVAVENVSVLGFEKWLSASFDPKTFAGGRFLIVLFASIWICDTAAYSGGRKLGRHKLAPSVSPNKTVEGAVFGFIFALLSFVLIGKLFLSGMPLFHAIASGIIVGLFGQLGDLVESRFKRDAGVKDTSTLLPGHGGILDRFDSLIFVSPFLWALFYFWG